MIDEAILDRINKKEPEGGSDSADEIRDTYLDEELHAIMRQYRNVQGQS